MSAVTIRDVAKYAAVGVGTVSRVLNQSPNVSTATRQRVLDAIADLEYRPNPIARQLSLGKSMTIGAIVPTFTRSSFVERLRGALPDLSQTDYDLIVYSVETVKQRDNYIQQSSLRERVDAIIIISVQLNEDEAIAFANAEVPVILIDAYHPLLNCVYIDDVKGGALATEYLCKLGHRRIGFINVETLMGNSSMADRFQGYQNALRANGIPFDKSLHHEAVYSRAAACHAATDMLSKPNPPTAIFAASDMHAYGVIQAAQKLNLRIPQDISIIGFDDVELSEFLQLTTVSQQLTMSGEVGAKMTLDVLKNPLAPPKQIEIDLRIVERGTVGPAASS